MPGTQAHVHTHTQAKRLLFIGERGGGRESGEQAANTFDLQSSKINEVDFIPF